VDRERLIVPVDRERLRQLDEEMADVEAGAGVYPPDGPHDVYLHDVFVHPEGGGLYDTLDCPGGSKVALLREFPVNGSGPVWFRMIPIGPRAEGLPQRLSVGTAEEVHGWYADALRQLAGDGWQISGAVSVDAEVVEADAVAEAEVWVERGRPIS
jgi:hypothetical protein